MKIGYIGTGIMGAPMALNLLRAGHEMFVYNRTISKCDSLKAAGAVVCDSPGAVAAKSDIVFINVPDTPDVQKVLFGDAGVIHAARAGLIVADNSTISAGATKEFAAKLKVVGVDYLDAPVSGGDVGAQKGTLAIMVGGEKEVFDKVLPLLEVLGSKVSLLGPVGSGQMCKACNQMFCTLHMQALCEAITLAENAGLDVAKMVDIVSGGAAGSWALSNLGPKILANDLEPAFMIDLLVKDLKLVMELAADARVAIPATAMAKQFFHAAEAKGLGSKGTQALIEVVRGLSK
ncbi:MAG: NAD(P)-dependent oxidoreductase [Phycisphaerae bacterium]|nr:NAD(P)-dependent oxidoreductase [Phycisphaerae bacterium]